jgi:hypothetical protein
MGWKIFDEPVQLVSLRFRYLPRAFVWRGQRHEVESVEQCWTVSRVGWSRRVQRRFFRVRCSAGRFELYQDLRVGTWHLRRARLTPLPVPAVWQTVRACQ